MREAFLGGDSSTDECLRTGVRRYSRSELIKLCDHSLPLAPQREKEHRADADEQ
jgi:hypothetical protein